MDTLQKEDHVRTQGEDGHLQTSGEASGQSNFKLPVPSLRSCGNINVCCLSAPACGTWLWQPELRWRTQQLLEETFRETVAGSHGERDPCLPGGVQSDLTNCPWGSLR